MIRLETWVECRRVKIARFYMTIAWLVLPFVFVWAWAALVANTFALASCLLGNPLGRTEA